jgi:hypothetical protein
MYKWRHDNEFDIPKDYYPDTFDKIGCLLIDVGSWFRARTDGQPHYLTKTEIKFMLNKLIEVIDNRFDNI